MANLIFGVLFESLFISIMFSEITKIKTKWVHVIIFCCYVFSGICIGFNYINQYWFYVLFPLFVFLIFRYIMDYKICIVNMFIIFDLIILTAFISMISIAITSYGLAGFLLSRLILLNILLGSLLIDINKYYLVYLNLWNRNYEQPNRIKAISVRNVNIILLNIFLFISYMLLYNMVI